MGTGRGQKRGRGFKHLRDHYSVHAREMAKLLQHQHLSLSEINELLSAPNLQDLSRQSNRDDPESRCQRGVIRLEIKMPGSEVLEVEVNSSATIQDINSTLPASFPQH